MKKKEDDNGKPKRKQYEKEMDRLQVELCKLQAWVKYKGLRVITVFEGRGAAGKGGHDSRHHRTRESSCIPFGSASRSF